MLSFNVKDLVISHILIKYPTETIEQTLGFHSRLSEDLGLTPDEIYMLGLFIEGDLQRMGLPSFSDQQILSWHTVQNIVDTILSFPGVHHVDTSLYD